MTKLCTGCNTTKGTSHYHKNRTRKDGLQSICKECITNTNKKHNARPETKKKSRDRQLLANYGITSEEYEELFSSQHGRCAICNKHQLELTKALCVDHNHDTGAVRGLLCSKCNVGIGNLQDSKDLLVNAIDYLERYEDE